jgi:hypothetical protein
LAPATDRLPDALAFGADEPAERRFGEVAEGGDDAVGLQLLK